MRSSSPSPSQALLSQNERAEGEANVASPAKGEVSPRAAVAGASADAAAATPSPVLAPAGREAKSSVARAAALLRIVPAGPVPVDLNGQAVSPDLAIRLHNHNLNTQRRLLAEHRDGQLTEAVSVSFLFSAFSSCGGYLSVASLSNYFCLATTTILAIRKCMAPSGPIEYQNDVAPIPAPGR